MGEICAMAQMLHALPSEILHLTDPYQAFCFDEAASVYMTNVKSGRKLAQKKTKDNSDLIARIMTEKCDK